MTSPKFLTEPDAWREIARQYEAGERRADPEGRFYGLCDTISITLRRDMSLISEDMLFRMWERIDAHMAIQSADMRDADEFGKYGDHLYAFASRDTDIRILAALFLALEAEDDASDGVL